jgi:hypothetical protein
MKNLLLVFSLSLFVLACGSNDASQPETEEADTVTQYSWEALLNDSTGKMEMKKIEPGGPDTLDAPSMIAFLNKINPNVQLQLEKISGDTLYVSIPEATYLTQQMGSTGPALFFAEVVYNLTEIPGIRFVSFDFEEGDHASPAVLSRERYASASNDL